MDGEIRPSDAAPFDLARELADAQTRLDTLRAEYFKTMGVIDFINHLIAKEKKG